MPENTLDEVIYIEQLIRAGLLTPKQAIDILHLEHQHIRKLKQTGLGKELF